MENNLRRCQAYLDRHGLSLRPHIKTHKIFEFAHLQIKLGAKGVNCQKLGEAEVMVDAGIADILLTYNLIGQTKLDRLVALARRSEIKVVADSKETVERLSSAMSRAGLELPVLVECDTRSAAASRRPATPSRWLRRSIARQGSNSEGS
jgi:D-serine deaminase-like pyridoxal phosphate-dependent protein